MQILLNFLSQPGVLYTCVFLLCGFISIIIGKIIGYHPGVQSSMTGISSASIICFMWGLFLGPLGCLIVLFIGRREQHLKRLKGLILALDDESARNLFCQRDVRFLIRLLKYGVLIMRSGKVLYWVNNFLIGIFIGIGLFCLLFRFIIIVLPLAFIEILIQVVLRDYIGVINDLVGKPGLFYETYTDYYFFKRMDRLLEPAEDLLCKAQEKQVYFK